MVVAGLLFLAFAYFAVGQASMKKNEAQTAADAAALAAATDARDQLSWPEVFDLDGWDDLLSGRGAGSNSCEAADWLAAANDAHAIDCFAEDLPETSYTVTVESNKPVGDSVIAVTKTTKAKATARAVIEPRCRIEEDARPEPSPAEESEDDGDTGQDEEQKAYKVVCDDADFDDFDIDPKHLDLLPDLADLFSVHLADK
ncbi:cell wall-associated NlpC family hydrolase [Streptomyces sp. HB132]|nr:cell wall-associated NlpC family hydrolase [Streptomyces sp. HB132]